MIEYKQRFKKCSSFSNLTNIPVRTLSRKGSFHSTGGIKGCLPASRLKAASGRNSILSTGSSPDRKSYKSSRHQSRNQSPRAIAHQCSSPSSNKEKGFLPPKAPGSRMTMKKAAEKSQNSF